MANSYQVDAEQLREGTTVFIRGKLDFARLTRLIEGTELAAVNQRRAANRLSPINSPHTTATLSQSEVLYADPSNPTLEEKFVAERRYVSKKNPGTGQSYSIDSKGSLASIYTKSEDGTYVQDLSGKELARGLDVTLVLRIYKPKAYAKRGIAIDQVLVNEDVRYYSAGGGVSQDELAKRGIVLAAPPVRAAAVAAAAEEVDGVDVEQLDNTSMVTEDGFIFPAPQAAPAAVAAPAAPAAKVAPAPAPASAPATTTAELSLEEQLEAIMAENAKLKAAQAGDNGSAIGANPWEDAEKPGISYQR